MGTRCLTRVFDTNGKELICLYRQHDGYLSGHGAELAEFLSGLELVNGIRFTSSDKVQVNGAGCLAAQLVAHFKEGPGSFYLYPPGSTGVCEEYVYDVRVKPVEVGETDRRGDGITMTAHGHGKELWSGLPAEFDADKIDEASDV
jgi:hypothetical protein